MAEAIARTDLIDRAAPKIHITQAKTRTSRMKPAKRVEGADANVADVESASEPSDRRLSTLCFVSLGLARGGYEIRSCDASSRACS